jgi:phosphoribosylglycinamide formyltransferase 1
VTEALRIAVLASGRGSNFAALCGADLGPGRIVLALSDRPDAPVLEAASRLGVEALYIDPGPRRTVFSPEAELAWADALEERGTGLVCLAGLMRLLKGPLLERFPGRVMNIHPSLLPSFPGLEAQRQALEHGARVSGCTVHFVDAGVDSGPIILQACVEVLPGDTAGSLSARILEREHSIYPEAVRLFCEGRLSVEGRIVRILPQGTRGGHPGRPLY